jgi:hypothetical protein
MTWLVVKIVGITLAVLAAAGVVLYTFGTPQAQGTVAPAAAVPTPTSPTGGARMVSGGAARTTPRLIAPDPNVPLAIEIPGCRCHSKDPKLVKQHETYRMNQCAGCHAGGVPTGTQ